MQSKINLKLNKHFCSTEIYKLAKIVKELIDDLAPITIDQIQLLQEM